MMELYTRVECPYNKSHLVLPLRMPYHLHKCRKNHPNVEMAVCPYNATHEVRAPELKYHMANCYDKTLLERDMSHNALRNALIGREEDSIKGNTDIPRQMKAEVRDENLENWDEDVSRVVIPPRPTMGRRQCRKHDRYQHRQLRIPQTKSVAASLAQHDVHTEETSTTSRLDVNDMKSESPVTQERLSASDGRISPETTSSSPSGSESDGSSQIYRSRLMDTSLKTKHDTTASVTPLRSSDSESRCLSPETSSSQESPETSTSPFSSDKSPPIFKSKLLPLASSGRPGHNVNFLFALGRGRARPTPLEPAKEHRPLFNMEGVTSPTYIRLGRGKCRPTV